jgi:CheY-like chemotaxis protein/two-component sensor histidine kinase
LLLGDHRKDEFLATLAHELRNPLAPLRSGLAVLQREPQLLEAGRRTVQAMERQLEQLVRLVDDLLDVSRVSRGKIDLQRSDVPLAALVEIALETSRPLIERARQRLTVVMPERAVHVHADAVRLAQVLANLLNNASKYTPAGGHVGVEARVEPPASSMPHGTPSLVIDVTDDGFGIPPEQLESIFQLFTQLDHDGGRSQGGLGIGLSLARRLVELHGGTLRAYSAGTGTGSTFTVRLPMGEAAAPGPAAGHHSSQADHVAAGDRAPSLPAGRDLLVVDDNRDAAESLAMLLELNGHVVRIAHDGPSALQLARERAPGLVFLDIGMPGMTGHELAQALRHLPGMERAVLVAVTGWGGERDIAQAHEAGIDLHLTKPVSEADLMRALAFARDD